MKERIYLDDVRTPIDKDWIIARNYDEFVKIVKTYGLENIKTISLKAFVLKMLFVKNN